MLIELKDLHRELLAAIAALEALVAAPEPQRRRLSGTRAQLVNASARRRRWIDNHVYPHLLGQLPIEDERQLERLRIENDDLREQSLRHVNHWTVEAIVLDWSGYRRASAAMLAGMRRRIAAEQALLYPLLDRVPMRPHGRNGVIGFGAPQAASTARPRRLADAN